MAQVKVAIRRLYLARGCSLKSLQELEKEFEIGEYKAHLYLGKKPKLNIDSVSRKKTIPFDPNKMVYDETDSNQASVKIELSMKFTPVEESDFQGEFFTDIFCWREIKISDELYKDLNTQETEANAKDTILVLAKQHKEEFETVCSIIAGILGLRLHYQFVYEMINEQYWVWLDRGNGWAVEGLYSPALHILEKIELTKDGQSLLENIAFTQEASIEDMSDIGFSLSMLLHGWQEHEIAYKFINFFTALEIALKNSTSAQQDKTYKDKAKKIRTLIEQSSDESMIAELKKFLTN